MPVLGQTAAAAARSFPRAQVGPPAGCRPTGKPVSGMLGHGPAARRRETAVRHAAGGLVGRAPRPRLARPYQEFLGRLEAPPARTRRGPWPWAAGPAPKLRRGQVGNPGPNRRRFQIAGLELRVAPGAPGSLAFTHCRHQGGHRHHAMSHNARQKLDVTQLAGRSGPSRCGGMGHSNRPPVVTSAHR